ncbi:hypothetical protein RND81_01G173900 [Saponaria officinalis]|uniref:RRM domain-containing protein n=1 Tax=Saponaria officinalis TaxID=3572 RepID=A0AAW1NGB5_SAPOF
MAYQGQYQYRSPFGDTTYTKVFVGGLAWETPTEKMRSYFEQFGEILEAVIITDKNTAKSKGYGFVTFRDPAAAVRACADANPMIDGRRANCNIASFGRPRPSPPRGRNQGVVAQGQSSSSSHSGMPTPQQSLQPPPYFFQPYGYPYTTAYGYQGAYNPQVMQQSQYYAQFYGGGGGGGAGGSTTSSSMVNPYYYGGGGGYSRAGYSSTTPGQRISVPPYYYYPAQMEGGFTTPQYPNPAATPFLSCSAASLPSSSTPNLLQVPSSSEEAEPQQSTSEEPEAKPSN